MVIKQETSRDIIRQKFGRVTKKLKRQLANIALSFVLIATTDFGIWTNPPTNKVQSKRSRFMTEEAN